KNTQVPGKNEAFSQGHQIGMSSGFKLAICLHQLKLPMLNENQIINAKRRRTKILFGKSYYTSFINLI
ncbi:MAG: hypothetical protein NC238_01270, partial [Dehalobacter sp.]|nr:hypothetical protein [Dehalobacter sp.]